MPDGSEDPSNYMMMQNPPPGGPISQNLGVRIIKDSKKSEFELQTEVAELKKQRNKDQDHIKILKVELQKLDYLFKKYKECVSPENAPQIQLNIPTLAMMAQQSEDGIIDTDSLLLEI